jgi:phosphoribosylamine--glycine ligase
VNNLSGRALDVTRAPQHDLRRSSDLVKAGMNRKSSRQDNPAVMALGVGSFAFSVAQTLQEHGASVTTYLTRDYGHFPPSLAGATFLREAHPSPVPLIKKLGVELIVPQSIDWAQSPWAADLLKSGVGILSPTGEGMRIERERDFARKLCAEFKISFPKSFVASNRLEAETILKRHPHPFVLKNPLCSPTSPMHTILCESVEDTRAWLKHVNYAEGVFLQEFAGRAEAGHIALVSGGEIYSLVTNQEYKRAFNGNLGIVAGAPLGGLVEADPNDKYGLARELIHPLLPWLRKVKFHGPIQVTAVKRRTGWCVIEYNIRIGVTSGAMILRLLGNPLETLMATTRNKKLAPRFQAGRNFGCSITFAGYGYPFTQVKGPPLPVDITTPLDRKDCDVWWNEATRDAEGQFIATGHRIADVIGFGLDVKAAIAKAYANIRRLRSPGSYFRTDIGESLWPPGNE